jgi:hypothetical protein
VPQNVSEKLAVALAVADAKNEGGLSTVEKAEIVIGNVSGKNTVMDAFYAVLPEETWVKVDIAVQHGAAPKDWVDFKKLYSKKYGSKNPSMERVEDVLDEMRISDQAKAALWQIANKSWKAANNPYNTLVGSMVAKQL